MAAKLTWAQAVELYGGDEARLAVVFAGDTSAAHPLFDTALSMADGVARGKITTRYPAATWDALTSETCPDYIQFHLLSLAASNATARDNARPEMIDRYAGLAAGWLDDVAASRVRIIEFEDVPAADLPTARGVAIENSPRVFDASDSDSTFNRVLPEF